MRRALCAFATVVFGVSTVGFGQSGPSGTPQQEQQAKIPTVNEKVTVTASRTALTLDAGASSVRVLSEEDLQKAPAFTLDDSLKQVAGFQLFRRTSSWVANPTSQGISLRGLGSTAASRTLVLSDQVPFNDAFGTWVHWNEVPRLAITQVDVMRGGASDLYGSSAMGGAINVIPADANKYDYGAVLDGGQLGTVDGDGLLSGSFGPWSALGAVTLFDTNGYVLTPPALRGPVDVPAFAHWQSGRTEIHRRFNPSTSGFLRGNFLNENRGNGTRLQVNATRLWRYQAGSDWNSTKSSDRAFLRLYGAEENYRQSFGSITSVVSQRDTERLTKIQHVPSEERGGSVQWARGFTAQPVTVAVGADVRDVRATDVEITPTVTPNTIAYTSARQRDPGVYALAVWQPKHWTLQLSSRYDRFSIIDPKATPVNALVTGRDENIFSPRLGIVRDIGRGFSLTGSVFRAFRGPSLNELYRTSQVGQVLTTANPSLLSEHATGFEAGANANLGRDTQIRATGFWTEVNRPITTVVVSLTPTSETDHRVNAGQLRSRGMMLETRFHPVRPLLFTAAYQLAVSTVTKFDQQPSLVGKWSPEIPRNSFSFTTTAEDHRLGRLNFFVYASGRQYDDSTNNPALMLHSYFRFDVQAERDLSKRLTASVSVQNLLDRTIEAGRTPSLTTAQPQTVTMRLAFHRAQ